MRREKEGTMERLASIFLILMASAGMGMAQDTVTVRPSNLVNFLDNLPGWRFGAEGALIASLGELVVGPGQPPLGGGSAALEVLDSTGGMTLQYFSSELVALPISELTRLEYCSAVEPAPGAEAVSLQFNFDDDVTDNDFSYKGRLVFEPARTPGNEVIPGVWQCWDALAGYWWATRTPLSATHGIDNPGSLMEILALHPNAGFNSEIGGLILKAGSGWDSSRGYADAVTLGTLFGEVTFDFEQEPFDKDACEDGGWQNYGFSNQELCIQFVNERDSGGKPWAELFLPPSPNTEADNNP